VANDTRQPDLPRINPLVGDPPDDEVFPWADVSASRAATRARRGIRAAQTRYGPEAAACPACGAPATTHAWFYFESPAWTWDHLCGRAGWMTVCDPCHRQVNFFLEILN